MEIKSKGKGMELLLKSLPYPEQIKDIDMDKPDAIYFKWRDSAYKLDIKYFRVDNVVEGNLVGTDTAMLMTQLLKNNAIAIGAI